MHRNVLQFGSYTWTCVISGALTACTGLYTTHIFPSIRALGFGAQGLGFRIYIGFIYDFYVLVV